MKVGEGEATRTNLVEISTTNPFLPLTGPSSKSETFLVFLFFLRRTVCLNLCMLEYIKVRPRIMWMIWQVLYILSPWEFANNFMYKISLELSSSQDVVNVFHMLKLYGIIWQCPEQIREYQPPFTCPLLSTTSGFGFGWANLLLQPYGEDRECRRPFSCSCSSTRDGLFLLYWIMWEYPGADRE